MNMKDFSNCSICIQAGTLRYLTLCHVSPSVVFLSLGKIFQTGTLNTSARSCEKVTQVARIDLGPEEKHLKSVSSHVRHFFHSSPTLLISDSRANVDLPTALFS